MHELLRQLGQPDAGSQLTCGGSFASHKVQAGEVGQADSSSVGPLGVYGPTTSPGLLAALVAWQEVLGSIQQGAVEPAVWSQLFAANLLVGGLRAFHAHYWTVSSGRPCPAANGRPQMLHPQHRLLLVTWDLLLISGQSCKHEAQTCGCHVLIRCGLPATGVRSCDVQPRICVWSAVDGQVPTHMHRHAFEHLSCLQVARYLMSRLRHWLEAATSVLPSFPLDRPHLRLLEAERLMPGQPAAARELLVSLTTAPDSSTELR